MQVLKTNIYKKVNVTPPIIKSLFHFPLNQYNLKTFQDLSREKRNMVNYGLETLIHQAFAIWAKLPSMSVLAILLNELISKMNF